MQSLNLLLDEAAAAHGHLCPGQVLGVRMAVAGCRALGIDEPRSSKRLLVYVEIDRCAADAIGSVTGCRLGKRTMKHMDYGKMAATFVDMATGRAVRVVAREEARALASAYASHVTGDRHAVQRAAYAVMPDEALLTVQEVRLTVAEEDRPGPPVSRVCCDRCGEGINDRREVRGDGRVQPRALLTTMGLSNLLAGLLGGMPICHGSGGLTAHVRFGARTGAAPLFIGGVCLGVAFLLDGSVSPLLALFPYPVLGVLLFYVGLQHGLLVTDLRRPSEWAVAIGIAVISVLVSNLAVGFLAGAAVYWLPAVRRWRPWRRAASPVKWGDGS